MRIKQLRLLSGCPALRGADSFAAGPKVKITRLSDGAYLVVDDTRAVILGAARVDFAVPDEGALPAEMYVERTQAADVLEKPPKSNTSPKR